MTQPLPDFKEEFSAKLPALALLSTLGYQFVPPAECEAMRACGAQQQASQVILVSVLRDYLAAQTFSFAGKQHHLSAAAIEKIIHQLSPSMNLGLIAANEKIHDAIVYGVSVTEFIDGKKVNPTIQLVHWNNTHLNQFHVTEEMVISNTQRTGKRIPDIVCFVNGLPWVVIEAKRPDSKKGNQPTISAGVSQQTRNQGQLEIPHLFAYSQLLLSVNGVDGLYATCGTAKKFWTSWKEEQLTEAEFVAVKNQALPQEKRNLLLNHCSADTKDHCLSLLAAGKLAVTNQDRLLISLLSPQRLLEITRLFCLFDKKSGKVVARYQQFFGIKALIDRVTTFNEQGARNGGVIWHTTGSGKSYTMAFLAKALVWIKGLAQCRVVIVTDRVDLEKQLSKIFASAGLLTTEQEQKKAITMTAKRLAKQIGSGNERIIFTISNKFASAVKLKACYNDSPNILVLVDEGYPSQKGENNIYMQQALPRAAFIAFTGTPLLKADKTENKFGKIIHSYTMQQAVKDKTVTPLLYEERIPELMINEAAIDTWLERMTMSLTTQQQSDLKKKFAQKGYLYSTEGRIELIAHDISEHFQHVKPGLKGQLACRSKICAIRYQLALERIGRVASVVAISAPNRIEGEEAIDQKDYDIVRQWWRDNVGSVDENDYTKACVKDFGQADGPDILIVVDKLLTGFDEKRNSVLYIDKPLKAHNLIQAIARVNRLHSDKQFGYLIDYVGILKELDVAIEKCRHLTERTRCGFDVEDLKGLYQPMLTEYKKLPGLVDTLWGIFSEVKNKQDPVAMRQVLSPKMRILHGQWVDTNLKKRDDFYVALTDFSRVMQVALQSASYFNDKSFDRLREYYKQTLKTFINLHQQVRGDASETVDYTQYKDEVGQLLNRHVQGVAVTEPGASYAVKQSEKRTKPEEMSEDEARNRSDKITGRMTKMIEQDLADDPYAQAHFSTLLKQNLEEANAMFDAPVRQYLLMVALEEKIKSRNIESITEAFNAFGKKKNKQVQAYFGLFKHLFGSERLTQLGLNDEKLVDYAFKIARIVNNAVAEYSIAPVEIENAISIALLPLLFTDLGLENAQYLIQEILKMTRLGISC